MVGRYYDSMTTAKQVKDRKSPVLPKPPARSRAGASPAPAPDLPKTVTVKGRVIEVCRPTDEQLFAWDRVLRKLERAAKEIENANQARRLMEKCDAIINSVIANEEDRDWLEDGQLDGSLTLQDAGHIVLDALKAYELESSEEAPNRAARRVKA